MQVRIRYVCALAVMLVVATAVIAEEKAALDFKPLFDAKPLSEAWVVRAWDDVSNPSEAHWRFTALVLHGGEPRGSWLLSKREYGDFELKFEFKLGEQGNSGLALRAPLDGDPAFDGLELQMADLRYNPEAKDSELTGGLYRAVAPQKQVYKPTEWNEYHVELRGARLKVWLNGELIQDLDLAEQSQPVKRHDGSDAPPIKDRPRQGHIGFQELSRGGSPVLIRKALIRELD